MRFENIALLVDNLEDTIKNMSYCWIDSYGLVMKQNGVFRVNCIDCLDRTNVVQVGILRLICFLLLPLYFLINAFISHLIRKNICMIYLDAHSKGSVVLSAEQAGIDNS